MALRSATCRLRLGRRYCREVPRLRQEEQGLFRVKKHSYPVEGSMLGEPRVVHCTNDERGAAVSVFPSLRVLPQRVLGHLDVLVAQLLPKGCGQGSVRPSYYRYVSFYSVAAVAGSMSMVFSTQSMLYAAGLGVGSVPVAAALAWVLKDGIGQLGGVLFASCVNTNFDADPKRWRFVAGAVLDIAALIEASIPFVPALFLPLAALANTLKNISFLAASASRASIHSSFARRGNLADITAKAGAQTTMASTIGTSVGAAISALTGGDCGLIFTCVVFATAVHIITLTLAIRTAPICTLNQQRYELVAKRYLETGEVFSPEEVAKHEVFLGTWLSHVWNGYRSEVVVGPKLPDFLAASSTNPVDVLRLLEKQRYALARASDGKKLILLHDTADGTDTLRAVYESIVERNAGRSFEEMIRKLEEAGWQLDHCFVEESSARVAAEHS